jgi:hypothetical protein
MGRPRDRRNAPRSRPAENVIRPNDGEIAELQTERDQRHAEHDRPEGVVVREAYAQSKNQPHADDRDEDPDSKAQRQHSAQKEAGGCEYKHRAEPGRLSNERRLRSSSTRGVNNS